MPTSVVAWEDSTALAWDGVTYWAVWAVDSDASRPFIRSVSATGVRGPVSQLVDDQCQGPSLASNGQQQLLLTCFKFSSRFRIVRVTTRLIDTTTAAPGQVRGPPGAHLT